MPIEVSTILMANSSGCSAGERISISSGLLQAAFITFVKYSYAACSADRSSGGGGGCRVGKVGVGVVIRRHPPAVDCGRG